MDTLDALAELAEAEYRVPEINAQIDAQRRLIEALAFEGHDITSAQLVLDSLLMSLFLCIEERQRLRSILNIKGAEALPHDVRPARFAREASSDGVERYVVIRQTVH